MKVRLSEEFALVAACCRWPRDAAADGLVVKSAAEVEDWPRFVRIVRRQRVEGLVYNALQQAQAPIPEVVRRGIGEDAHAIARQNLMFAAESVRLQALFRAAAIPLIFVKGLTPSWLAYGSIALKKA